ncbi:hypothetical protein DY023_06550 [Microbacterium bovistercoris]|uniref:Uncharacterized protein n=1 Tax=Microbacterium bovistercoris TaxID=2293570 RepID=A0A371NV02_9MICO|nr:hypothetical protein [Microbacterium bovistercoris]REJ06285.1 hypothetical protein DY023_06550 [Microbacterium bovistercoris]
MIEAGQEFRPEDSEVAWSSSATAEDRRALLREPAPHADGGNPLSGAAELDRVINDIEHRAASEQRKLTRDERRLVTKLRAKHAELLSTALNEAERFFGIAPDHPEEW